MVRHLPGNLTILRPALVAAALLPLASAVSATERDATLDRIHESIVTGKTGLVGSTGG